MSKVYFSRRCLKLFLGVLVIGVCSFLPEKAFAKKISGEKTITNPEQTVNGTIKEAGTGKALSGATITVKGSLTNTVSDANGAFTITVTDNNSILVISHVGYATQEVAIGNSVTLEISLQPTAS